MHKSSSSTDLVAQVKARLNLAEHVIIPDIGAPHRHGHRLAWRARSTRIITRRCFSTLINNRIAALAAERAAMH